MKPELYTEEEWNAVEAHIHTYYGKVENVFHEIVSPDIHVDIYIVPPGDRWGYYRLVTLGMGAHRMAVPADLKEHKLERAELTIALGADWKINDDDEKWYWPIRLLKVLARLPMESDTWLGWGHSIENGGPFADNTALCASLLVTPFGVEEEGFVCPLPNSDEVNFYQVIPLYQNELEYKQAHGTDALLLRLLSAGFVVRPDRPNALTDFVMDDAAWHLEILQEKKLPVEEITACNHLAIYLRWCLEHGLLSKKFLALHGAALRQTKKAPAANGLREFIRRELHGHLKRGYFNEDGAAFADYYYGDGGGAPYFPSDIDDYALRYFGAARYYSEEFKEEAYLFVPFNEAYYQDMARIMDRRWIAWQNQKEPTSPEDREPGPLAEALIAYLDCDCQYFPPLADDDPITAAFGYAKRIGAREGFIPVLVAADEGLWDALMGNSDPQSDSADKAYTFNAARVEAYRDKLLAQPVKDGRGLLSTRREDFAKDAADSPPARGEAEANNSFMGYWDYETGKTIPLILAEIPVKNPWEVFAYLPFGGWNECPDAADLMAAAKYWHERYGAVPAVMTHDVLEFLLPAPVPHEAAWEVAQEHYAFCPDVIEQGGADMSAGKLSRALIKSHVWHFRWD